MFPDKWSPERPPASVSYIFSVIWHVENQNGYSVLYFLVKSRACRSFFTTARNWSVKYKSEFFGLFPLFYSSKATTFEAAITSSHFSWNFLKKIQTKIYQKEMKFSKLLPDFFHSTLKSSKMNQYLQVKRNSIILMTVFNASGRIDQKTS